MSIPARDRFVDQLGDFRRIVEDDTEHAGADHFSIESGQGEQPGARSGYPGDPPLDDAAHRIDDARHILRIATAAHLRQPCQLAHEQRVAAGAVTESAGAVEAHVGADQAGHHRRDVGGGQSLESDDLGGAGDPAKNLAGLDVPVGAEHGERAAAQLAGDELQQAQRVGVGPLEVVQHDDQPVGPAALVEDAGHAVEQSELVIAGLAGPHVLVSRQRADRPQHLRPWPERRCTRSFAGTTPRRSDALRRGVVGGLGDQHRLADARLAADEHQRAVAGARPVDRHRERGGRRAPSEQRHRTHRTIVDHGTGPETGAVLEAPRDQVLSRSRHPMSRHLLLNKEEPCRSTFPRWDTPFSG